MQETLTRNGSLRMRGISIVIPLICTLTHAAPIRVEIGPKRPIQNPTQALSTLAKLRAKQPDQAVELIFDGGRYELNAPLQLRPEHSGTATATVTWKAAPGQYVEFSGAREIRGFTVQQDHWEAPLPDHLLSSQLWINGSRVPRARHPNQGTLSPLQVTEELLAGNPVARQTVRMKPEDLAPLKSLPSPAGLQILVYHKWDNTRRNLESFDTSKGQLTTVGNDMKKWNKWDEKSGIIFENARELLDAPGEWFQQQGKIYYIPRKNEKPEQTTALVPVLNQLLLITGKPDQPVRYHHWENITFSHTHWSADAGFLPQQAAASIGAAIEATWAENLSFHHITVTHTANYAIWFRKGTRSCRVEQSSLTDLGAGGFRAGEMEMPAPGEENGSHRFHNNIIQHTGNVFPCAVGVWIGQSSHNEISHNLIRDVSYSGISVGWRWGYAEAAAHHNRILYNHIHHIGDGELSDLGGVYTLGPSEGTEVSHNHIHHIISKTYGGWGLYTDEGSTGIRMENNLVHHTKSGGFHQHYGKNNLIRNNIFAFASDQQLQFTRAEDHLSFEFSHNIILWNQGQLLGNPGWEKGKIILDHNLYWNTNRTEPRFLGKTLTEWRAKTGHDAKSVIADPQFVDPEHGNWAARHAEALQQIEFKPFNPKEAGLTGDPSWAQPNNAE